MCIYISFLPFHSTTLRIDPVSLWLSSALQTEISSPLKFFFLHSNLKVRSKNKTKTTFDRVSFYFSITFYFRYLEWPCDSHPQWSGHHQALSTKTLGVKEQNNGGKKGRFSFVLAIIILINNFLESLTLPEKAHTYHSIQFQKCNKWINTLSDLSCLWEKNKQSLIEFKLG